MIIEVVVVPNSKRFSFSLKEGKLKVHLKSPPENNRANVELIKELSKLFGRPVHIISGATSKKKRLETEITTEDWTKFLNSLSASD